MRHYYIPTRVAQIKSTDHAKAGEEVEGRVPHTLLVGTQESTASLETSLPVARKAKHELPCDPAITLMGIYLKEILRFT